MRIRAIWRLIYAHSRDLAPDLRAFAMLNKRALARCSVDARPRPWRGIMQQAQPKEPLPTITGCYVWALTRTLLFLWGGLLNIFGNRRLDGVSCGHTKPEPCL